MKKLLFGFSLLAAAMAFGGAANDTVIFFSTPGIDRYADGNQVMDGECYALVWSKGTFAGIKADCTPVNSEDAVVLVAPVAKGGKCPTIAFEVDADKIDTIYKGGTFSVCLLDTRVKNQVKQADGSYAVVTTLSACQNGRPLVVSASDSVMARVSISGFGGSATADGAVVASAKTQLPEGVASGLKISSIKTDDKNVYLTVQNASKYVQYGVVSGGDPRALVADGETVNGSDELVIVRPKKGDSQIFQLESR